MKGNTKFQHICVYLPVSRSLCSFGSKCLCGRCGSWILKSLIYSNTVYDIQDLQRQILDLQRGPGSLPRRLGRGHGDQLLVLHPCNYCRYGLHRAGPIAPRHPLKHVWDRSRPWLVTFQQHLRMLQESMLVGNAWWRQGPNNYYCVACHTWWKNLWSEVWDHLILFCISIAHHEQPLHSEYRQHWSYILIL